MFWSVRHSSDIKVTISNPILNFFPFSFKTKHGSCALTGDRGWVGTFS